jgi:hypothetical protein
LELSPYSSEQILRDRLLYAMQTTTMNADEIRPDDRERDRDDY